MAIDIRINIDLTPWQKKIVRGAVVTGAVVAALGIGIAFAAPIDTTWIATGNPLSATNLAGDLNGLQDQISGDGGINTQIAALQAQISKPPSAFRALRTAAESFSSGTVQYVAFDTVQFDLGSEYNIDGIFTPKNTGTYVISCSLDFSTPSGNTGWSLLIVDNDKEIADVDAQSSDNNLFAPLVTTIVQLNAGDSVWCAVATSASTQPLDVSIPDRNSFSAARLY